MQTITAGGARLECRWWGARDGSGSTLVLLHEGLGCVTMWRDFPDLLHRRTGLRVFAWSRAGYGGSDPAGLPRQVDYMHVEGREVAGAVLDAAGIDDAVFVGHSDGASIAIVHAGEHSDGPARRIRALVLLAPHVFCEDVSIESIRAAGGAYRSGGLRERLARYHGDRVDESFFGWHDVLAAAGVSAMVDRGVPAGYHRAGVADSRWARCVRIGGATRRNRTRCGRTGDPTVARKLWTCSTSGASRRDSGRDRSIPRRDCPERLTASRPGCGHVPPSSMASEGREFLPSRQLLATGGDSPLSDHIQADRFPHSRE